MAQQTTTRARKTTAPAKKATRRPAARTKRPRRPEDFDEIEARPVQAGGGGITVPVPTLGVRSVHLPPPRAVMTGAVHGAAGVSDAVRDRLPDGRHMLYYGGLGALAAFGVLSWPAAAAIGGGVWIAEHARPGRRQSGADAANATSRR
jgi:hypothetical protein